ncbi:MAG: DEAD/DEAH box helicase family protein [Tissierellales bacterium]|nr:DEAD/DEAH box helicase family protein [Tissierellales bacterium]
MTEGTVINPSALEPLFAPWEEPVKHRIRGEKKGDPAIVKNGRRPSSIAIAQNLRWEVKSWRDSFYAGASDTSQYLLNHWFNRSHRIKTDDGDDIDFSYYFCQREGIETLIYLYEVRRITCLSQIVAEFGGPSAEIQALGITEEEDMWSRYAFKLGTGTGKTKLMSLAIVWSYFHSLRESDSDMTKYFCVIAPNLTVYERLKDDFGDGKIFDTDPLIPSEWRGDWNMSIILQGETSGTATGGTIYLTNIHRLFDNKRKTKKDADTYDWMGPSVSKVTALDTGAALRDRITSHQKVMVLNDEAHHVWDPDSAWNEAIRYLHETLLSRNGDGLVCQLDFSATPKDNKGQLFKHIICDTPLGEAVDAGIVKTPIIGSAGKSLEEQKSDDAGIRYDRHLRLGYERWKISRDEWIKSGKKSLMFVMCEDTEAADQIAQRLNTDEAFKELNGKTINLHTNLKGTIKKVGRGADARLEFVENEKQIKDEDLKALRKLSRELDHNSSQYSCIVSVLMLREGWDVRNVTTVIPLRPFSSKANILPEQTLGRGLRRMTTPLSGVNEIVTVIDHPSFASLYQQELAQEGLPIEIIDVEKVPRTTVTIFPDEARKDVKALEVEVPRLSAGHRIVPKLENITVDDIKKLFERHKPLPLGGKVETKIEYEGRQLFTGEIVERMEFDIPLLKSGIGAVSYYVKQLEMICKIRGIHSLIAPLLQTFLEEILFGKKTSLFEQELITRLGDSDVGEYIRAVFVPLIRKNTTTTEKRKSQQEPIALSTWRPYQATHSERRPVLEAQKTLFNLVPCNRAFEEAMTEFLTGRAMDVVAFAKNSGPQCLRIDYLGSGGRLAFYTPDFFVRVKSGNYYLIETKGREDLDVPRKARAAIEWCKSASTKECKWEYVYVAQSVFEHLTDDTVEALARTCSPSLQNLMDEEQDKATLPLFATMIEEEEKDKEAVSEAEGIVDAVILDALPDRYRKAADQAISVFRFLENKDDINYGQVFQALLGSIDEACRGLMMRRLLPLMPDVKSEQDAWFYPYVDNLGRQQSKYYQDIAKNLKKTLVYRNGFSPLGLLRTCLDYALNDSTKITGVFEALNEAFKVKGGRDFLDVITKINDFRNTYVAHQQKELKDVNLTKENLKKWIAGMQYIHTQP